MNARVVIVGVLGSTRKVQEFKDWVIKAQQDATQLGLQVALDVMVEDL